MLGTKKGFVVVAVVKKLDRVGYDYPNRFSLGESIWLPDRENPPNPSYASEGDFLAGGNSLHAGFESQTYVCDARVFRLAGLASFGYNSSMVILDAKR